MNEVLLKAEGIYKSFGATKAVVDFHIEVCRGTIHGLIGENGSGKSTFSSIVAGIQQRDSGRLLLRGEDYAPTSSVDAAKQGVSLIVQEIGTIGSIPVSANIFLNEERRFVKHGCIDYNTMNAEAKKILSQIGGEHIDPQAITGTLNLEDRKLVEIARGMYSEPELLIIDETSNALAKHSHAALFANGCFAEGMTKATFGTGTSVMMNAGASRPKQVPDGLVESVSWGRGGEVFYALEGNINYSGALIKWLVNDLELIQTSRESGQFAMQVKDTGGVYFVPAFSGLGAPYWDNDARAMICGITAATKKAHLVRAAEEAIAYQIRDITEQLALCGKTVGLLCVDGGATNDQFLMQFVSDMTGAPLKRSSIEELSAAGAAYLAALSAGIATQTEIFSSIEYTQVEPSMQQTQRERLYKGWKKAVAMVTEKKR